MSSPLARPLVIGTRGSDLALWQARHVETRLRHAHPSLEVRLEIIRTEGDVVTDRPLRSIGEGKGFFTKELEAALFDRTIDLAVHSLKDLPTTLPAGLALAAILEREDARDVWLGREPGGPLAASAGARVGTSSPRRRAQLLALNPALRVEDQRGNVPTRVAHWREGRWDAIVLASAGLTRLGLLPPEAFVFPPEMMVPAPGQGALAVEIREDDPELTALLGPLDHPETRLATTAERSLLRELEGGCSVPVAAWAHFLTPERLELLAMVASLDGRKLLRAGAEIVAPVHDTAAAAVTGLGRAVADTLRARGAEGILRAARKGTTLPPGRVTP